ncbi:oligosaccharide flippase family protein [uncultured Pseudoalteromonas sp.]|uniref:oligosaccharide flippase family protein n=1 Tax=uncultured Pseudoalteromonas sp. TaxID=114053 RepID=UPI0030C8B9CC
MKNSLFFITSKALSLLLVFLCTALIARELGPSDFGLFTEIKVYISVVFIVSLFGNDAHVISLMGEENDKEKIFTIILARISLFIILCIPGYFLFDFRYFLALFLMYFFQLFNLSFLKLSASKKGKVFFSFNVVAFLIVLLLGGVSEFYHYSLYLYFIPFYYFLLFILPIKLFANCISLVNLAVFFKYTKLIFMEVWPLILSSLLIFFYTKIDFILISHFLPPKELGIYSVAVQLSEPFSFVISAYATSIISDLNLIKGNVLEKSRFISHKLRYIHGFVFFFLVFYFLFGDFLIETFFGNQYESSYNFLLILIFSKLFVFSNLFFSVIMVVENNYLARLKRIFISMLIAILISIILIPNYGLYGAATSVVLSQLIAITFVNALSRQTKDYYMIFVRSFIFWK